MVSFFKCWNLIYFVQFLLSAKCFPCSVLVKRLVSVSISFCALFFVQRQFFDSYGSSLELVVCFLGKLCRLFPTLVHDFVAALFVGFSLFLYLAGNLCMGLLFPVNLPPNGRVGGSRVMGVLVVLRAKVHAPCFCVICSFLFERRFPPYMPIFVVSLNKNARVNFIRTHHHRTGIAYWLQP